MIKIELKVSELVKKMIINILTIDKVCTIQNNKKFLKLAMDALANWVQNYRNTKRI